MTVVERFREFAKAKGMSLHSLEKSLGKANSYLTQVKNMSSDVVVKALEVYPDLSAEWLFRGEGEMLRTGCNKIVECSGNSELEKERRKNEILFNLLQEAQGKIVKLEIELKLYENS